MSWVGKIGTAYILWIVFLSVLAITLAGIFGGGMGVAITIPSILGAVLVAVLIYYLFVSESSPIKKLFAWIGSKMA
jgi:hypothetical protein